VFTFRVLLAFTATVLSAADFAGPVVGVTDGDTIRVMRDGAAVRVRLWGIDCPEAKQPFGTRARQFTGDRAFGKQVTVRVRDIDRYGRTVGEVVLPDGANLNHELVRAGLAWWYRQFAPRDRILESLERDAQQAKRGVWSDGRAVPPWEWRRKRVPVSASGHGLSDIVVPCTIPTSTR
jgi:micrococcal nuclease